MSTKNKRSVEQKLFEAYQTFRGVRLTSREVTALVGPDNAIRTRITNVAAEEVGITPVPGCDGISYGETWEQLTKRILRDFGS